MSSESRELENKILLTLPVPAAQLDFKQTTWEREVSRVFCRTELSSIVTAAL